MTTLGLDISEKRLLAVVHSPNGDVKHKARYRMDRYLTPRACVMLVVRAVADARSAVGAIPAIGIGFPGQVDSPQGIARSSTALPGWENVRLAATVKTLTGLPCAVDSRTNNLARAELWLRNPKPDNFLFVNAGSELRAAFVLNRSVWSGATGLAGEIGHVCIDPAGATCACGLRGCAETVASQNAIGVALGISPADLSICMQTRRAACDQALTDAGSGLGTAIATAMNMLNVNLVVLGGPLTGFATYRTAVELTARNRSLDLSQAACTFELARTGSGGKGIGAALLGLELLASQSGSQKKQTAA